MKSNSNVIVKVLSLDWPVLRCPLCYWLNRAAACAAVRPSHCVLILWQLIVAVCVFSLSLEYIWPKSLSLSIRWSTMNEFPKSSLWLKSKFLTKPQCYISGLETWEPPQTMYVRKCWYRTILVLYLACHHTRFCLKSTICCYSDVDYSNSQQCQLTTASDWWGQACKNLAYY